MQRYQPKQWDLTELVKNPKGPKFEAQIKDIMNRAQKFQKNRKTLDPKMDAKKFRQILSDIEDVVKKISVIGGYASLRYSADTQSDEATALLTKMSKLGADVSNQMLFFDLWWKKSIDEKNAQRLISKSGDLSNYLSHKRLLARYALGESEEKIINIMDVTGVTALVKLYDKITNAFEYRLKEGRGGKAMTREELTSLVRSTKADVRKSAYKTLLKKYASNQGVLGEIYQNIVLNWRNEGIEIRGHASPISMRNIGNDVDDSTVSALLGVCKKNRGAFQRFFEIKAKMLGLKKLQRYDLYAPGPKFVEKKYSYADAVKLVLESLKKFSPELSKHAKTVFDQDHVDSQIRPGKRDGAFCSTLSPDITPYVLLNYAKKSKDVFTLAHEMGHAVHSICASSKSILVQDPPLPLAETASTFSELLLYDNISNDIKDGQRRAVLAEKIDDLYATIMRQSYFTIFEIDAHKQIAKTATVDEISKTYLKNLKEQFGGAVKVTDDFETEWSCIPHFYHTPFYCYAYSFGNLLALSLFQRFKKEGSDFVPAYTSILSAGGSQKPELLLEEYGIDIGSEAFWQDGFDYIREQVRELSKMN